MASFGKAKTKLRGTLKECAEWVLKTQKDGFEVYKAKKLTKWWNFWRPVYQVKMQKDVYMNIEIIADTNDALDAIEKLKDELGLKRIN